jgi:hypothetical protein
MEAAILNVQTFVGCAVCDLSCGLYHQTIIRRSSDDMLLYGATVGLLAGGQVFTTKTPGMDYRRRPNIDMTAFTH